MRFSIESIASAGFLVLVGVLASGCATQSVSKPERVVAQADSESAAQTLRIGIAPVYPPLAFRQNGKLTGIEVDFANRLGKELALPISYVETSFEELIPGLLANKYDVIMSGYSITPRRQEQISFTMPYMEVGQMTLVRAADRGRLGTQDALNESGVRLAAVSATTGEDFARRHLAKAKLQSYPSVEDAVKALRGGEVDAFIMDAPAVWDVRGRPLFADDQLRGIYLPLTREPLAWAVRKTDTRLLEQLNAQLGTWKANGVIEQIIDFWMPVRRVSLGTAD